MQTTGRRQGRGRGRFLPRAVLSGASSSLSFDSSSQHNPHLQPWPGRICGSPRSLTCFNSAHPRDPQLSTLPTHVTQLLIPLTPPELEGSRLVETELHGVFPYPADLRVGSSPCCKFPGLSIPCQVALPCTPTPHPQELALPHTLHSPPEWAFCFMPRPCFSPPTCRQPPQLM